MGGNREPGLGGVEGCPREIELGLDGVHRGGRRVEILHAGDALSPQFIGSAQGALGVFVVDLELLDGRPSDVAVGFGGFVAPPRVRVIETRQDLSFFDRHSLVHQHLGDPTGDLGGDGGLSPRLHVARGVEHRGRTTGWCGPGRGNLDGCDRAAADEEDRDHGDGHEDHGGDQHHSPAAAVTRPRLLLDLEVGKVGFTSFVHVSVLRVHPRTVASFNEGVIRA